MLIEHEEFEPETEESEEILLEPKEGKKGKKGREPEISFQAMEGSVSPKTVRLLGYVNKKPVRILLDTRSKQLC